MVRPEEVASLYKTGLDLKKKLPAVSIALEAQERSDAALFDRASVYKQIVSPLDKVILEPRGSKAVGQEILAQFSEGRGKALSHSIASSAAFTVARTVEDREKLVPTALRISELFSFSLGPNTEKLKAAWSAPLREFAQGISRFVDEQTELDEQTDEFVRVHGWPVPLNLPVKTYRRIVGWAPLGRREVNQAMTQGFRPGSRTFSSTVSILLESPQFEDRKPLISQAVSAYRRGHWYLVINALLPLVEGVLVDYAFRTGRKPGRSGHRKAIEKIQEDEDDASLKIVVSTLETLLLSSGANVALFQAFDPNQYGIPVSPGH